LFPENSTTEEWGNVGDGTFESDAANILYRCVEGGEEPEER
jgi:hypothetical protein